ncbi:MAG TPA: hypothetical protein VGE01_01795, partial [Fimbriimonas sp.]
SMSSDRYDPNAPEADVSRGSQYISKKDIKVLLIGLGVLAAMLAPFYFVGVRNSEKVRCSGHIGAVYQAMGLYATEHDDRMPPVYRTESDGITPGLGATGLPWTFASDTVTYMSARATYTCPSASEAENVTTEHPEGGSKRIVSSYGMYKPYGSAFRSFIPDPGTTILLAETSNAGSEDSFDPLPFATDGFVIGWDNSNEMPDKQTTAVTRLAFRNVAGGKFDEKGTSRHDRGIHAVTANGQLVMLKPTDSRVTIQKSTGLPVGFWNFPP